MIRELPWHHLHITLDDRETVAGWHEARGMVERRKPTPRSENLMFGPNLLQVQSEAVAPAPTGARIERIGLTVANPLETASAWQEAGASVSLVSNEFATLTDPFGTPFELVAGAETGFSHISIQATDWRELANWYVDTLGGQLVDCAFDPERNQVSFDTLSLTFSALEGEATDRVLDHLGWYTPELDATVRELENKGTAIPVPPRPFGQVRLAFAADPCGIWFELLEPVDGLIRKG